MPDIMIYLPNELYMRLMKVGPRQKSRTVQDALRQYWGMDKKDERGR